MALDLGLLKADPRFSKFFTTLNQPVQLAFWILESHLQGQSSLDLLYGQAVLVDGATAATWPNPGERKSLVKQSAQDGKLLRINEIRVRLLSSQLVVIIERLLDGKTLLEASDGITTNLPPSHLQNFKLIQGKEGLNKIVLRPPIFRSARETSASNFHIGPRKSHLSGVSPWIASLYRIDKFNLLFQRGSEFALDIRRLFSEASAFIQSSSGIDLLGEDYDSLGNFDWISCIGTSPDGKDLISYEANRSPQPNIDGSASIRLNGVRINISASTNFIGSELLVCCRIFSGDELMGAFARQVAFQADLEVQFSSPTDFTSTEISIWSKEAGTTDFVLCYESAVHYIREINVNIDFFSNNSGESLSEWINKLLNKSSPPLDQERQHLLAKQVNHSIPREYSNDPWSSIARQTRNFTKRINPPISRGQFFSRGSWGGEKRAAHIGDYISKLTESREISTLVLVDPYFDTIGVEALSKVRKSSIVLTTTGISSDDNDTENSNDRFKRIKRSIKKFSERLKHLNVWDIRLYGQDGKWKQHERYLHDRLIFLFNSSGILSECFHLSNSLQTATKNFPLLVTPVPDDLLPAMERDIKLMLHEINAPKSAGWKAIPINLESSGKKQKKTAIERHRESVSSVLKDGSAFFSLLFGDKSYRSLREQELTDELIRQGAYSPSENAFLTPQLVLDRLPLFISSLTEDSQIFNQHFLTLLNWSSHLRSWDSVRSAIIFIGGEKLRQLLFDWLNTRSKKEKIKKRRNEESIYWKSIFKMMKANGRVEVTHLLNAYSILLHGTRFGLFHSWAGARTLELISRMGPEHLLAATEIVAGSGHSSRSSKLNFIYCLELWNFQVAVRRPPAPVRTDPVPHLLSSSLPIMRAVGVAAEYKLGKSPSKLSMLQPLERILALCSWIYELRVAANQKGGHETPENAALKLEVFRHIVDCWPGRCAPTFLRDVIRLCSGPLEGNWAASTYGELLLELSNAGRLTIDSIANAWMTLLMEKLFPAALGHSSKGERRFSLQWDAELSLVAADALALSAAKCRKVWRDKFERLAREVERGLREPHLKSRDYEEWLWAVERLVWTGTIIGHSLRTEGARWSESEISELKDWGEPRFGSFVRGTSLDDSLILGDLLKFARGEVASNH